MIGTGHLLGLRLRRVWASVRRSRRAAWFRAAIIAFSSVVFWLGMYLVFSWGLEFFGRRIETPQLLHELVGSMLYLFFLVLTVMLVISNGVISYSALYRSKETAFLLASPVPLPSIFLYRFAESVLFSSWAILFLATPLLFAYGRTFEVHWTFYPLSGLFLVVFLLIPAGLGVFAAMLITNFLPRLRRRLLQIALLVGLVLVVVAGARILQWRARQTAEIRLVVEILEEVGWSRNPLLPSYWIAKGILELSAQDGGAPRYGESLFFLGLIAVNGVFGLTVLTGLAATLVPRGWSLASTRSWARRRASPLLDALVREGLFFLRPQVRDLVLKDLKSFLRDPSQWSQSLIFFGLMAVYFLNLRTFGYDRGDIFWRTLVAQMNLLATALTLATFSSRFIFPQLSLEGRRFWITGTLPVPRETILYGKLAFAFLSTLVVSEILIGISCVMLRVPATTAITHSVVLVGICLGLSGMAVGLGAVYPDFREDNPAKIVSGFGGTLNLVFNLIFVLACVVLQAVPFFLARTPVFGELAGPGSFLPMLLGALAAIAALSLFACLLPMSAGLRAIRTLEL